MLSIMLGYAAFKASSNFFPVSQLPAEFRERLTSVALDQEVHQRHRLHIIIVAPVGRKVPRRAISSRKAAWMRSTMVFGSPWNFAAGRSAEEVGSTVGE